MVQLNASLACLPLSPLFNPSNLQDLQTHLSSDLVAAAVVVAEVQRAQTGHLSVELRFEVVVIAEEQR